MTPAKRKTFQKALIALRKKVMTKTPRRIEPNRISHAEVGVDEDEQPLNEMEQAIASNLNRAEATLLARVDLALERLKSAPESFGECLECGEPVAEGRMKAMPYVELCVDCQAKRDRNTSGNVTRRKTTEFI
jgi:DnaK suppressor protein